MGNFRNILVILGYLLLSGWSAPDSRADEGVTQTTSSTSENDDFINPKINVASRLGADLRSSPSVVTVISAAEIARSGARDLQDILMMVPGFFPGVDVQGVVDFGVRGLWAHEGKMILLIDGREYNENAYGTNQFGNHFPVQLIERVEVIRGPGSALYGGYAELAAVNIVTKSAKDLNGAFIGVQAGFTENSYGQETTSFGLGKEWQDFSYSLTGFVGRGQRSDLNYTDSQGSVVNLANQSALDPFMINFAGAWKNLDVRLIADHYHTTSIDWYGVNIPNPYNNDFSSYLGNIRYKINVNEHWILTPEFRYRYMDTWQNTQEGLAGTDPAYFDYPTQRIKYKLGSVYSFSNDLKLNLGVEAIEDTAHDHNTAAPSVLANGASSVSYWTESLYGEVFYNFDYAELTAGGRFDHNSFSGNNFAPRIALVKPYQDWHWKLMWARSFREPSIFDIAANSNIEPEITTSYEGEIGFNPVKNLSLALNLYDVMIDKPIVYTSTPAGNSLYTNADKVGTVGAEFETRYAAGWGESRLNYSYYKTNQNHVSSYTAPQDGQVTLAFPSNKIALQSSVKLGSDDLRLTPSAVYFSKRYAYVNNVDNPSTLPAMLLLNLNLRKENLFFKGFGVSFGVFNITNQDFTIAQPYLSPGSAHPPLPTLSRDYVAQVSYQVAI